MFSSDQIGLCCGSVVQAGFRELAEAASSAGFRTISMWPTLFDAALGSGLNPQDLRRILSDNALSVTELDPFCSWLPIEAENAGIAGPFAALTEDDFFRVADVLGARTLNVIRATDDPVDEGEVVDHLAGLCERARRHDLIVSVEFMPWSPIPDLESALALVKATGQENCGVNIDTWHHFRSGGDLDQLANLDPARIAAVQFNDVAAKPWQDVLEETALGRLPPGQGVSDSAAVLRALWQSGVRVPIGVEVFNAELKSLPAAEAARHLGDAVREVLAQATRDVAGCAG